MRRTVLSAALSLSLIVGVTTALPAAAAATPCTWTASDLPIPAGTVFGIANAAAPNGYIAGTVYVGNTYEVAVWHDRVLTELPMPAGAFVQVKGVNDHGDVVGVNDHGTFAFLGGVYRDLPNPPGYSTGAIGINNRGDVVGWGAGENAFQHVVLWPASAPGTYRVISDGSRPIGIDDSGNVVTDDGRVVTPDGTTRRLPGADLVIQQFHGGRIVGRERADEVLIQWDVTGREINRTDAAVAVGINAKGLLAAWYFKNNDTVTLAAWRDGTFLGDVGDRRRVYAVSDDDQLVGTVTRPSTNTAVPATFSCS